MEKLLFYDKCRPQGVDAAEIATTNQFVFIGHPPWKAGTKIEDLRPNQVFSHLLDLRKDLTDTGRHRGLLRDVSKQSVSAHRKLANQIGIGSMVLIPQPAHGVCWIATVTGEFEVRNRPAWADNYLKLRRDLSADIDNVASHLGDICQGWPTSHFKKVPFHYMPGWVQYRLLSRNQIGIIRSPDERDPVAVVAKIASGEVQPSFLTPTRSAREVEQRLIDWVTPARFEHICCDIMQREKPEQHWIHCGGSGDGGADGLGFTNGQLTAVLQCKWKHDDPIAVGEQLRDRVRASWNNDVDVIVATLMCEESGVPSGPVQHLTRRDIAELLIKHEKAIAVAASLGICG